MPDSGKEGAEIEGSRDRGNRFCRLSRGKVLREKGFHVRALVRKESNTSDLGPLGVELFRGDVRDFESVCRALAGCQSPAEGAMKKAVEWFEKNEYIKKTGAAK